MYLEKKKATPGALGFWGDVWGAVKTGATIIAGSSGQQQPTVVVQSSTPSWVWPVAAGMGGLALIVLLKGRKG